MLWERLRQFRIEGYEKEEEILCKIKLIHGMYHQQIEEGADMSKYQWQEMDSLQDTSGLLQLKRPKFSCQNVIQYIYIHTRYRMAL